MRLSQRQAIASTGALTLLFFASFWLWDAPLKDAGGPGIAGFEMVWTAERAARFLAQWGDELKWAKFSLWIDYAFMPLYGFFFWLVVRALGERLAKYRPGSRLVRWSPVIALMAVGAAISDAIENVFLLIIVYGSKSAIVPPIASTFVTIKFTLLAIVITFIAASIASTRRASKQAKPASA